MEFNMACDMLGIDRNLFTGNVTFAKNTACDYVGSIYLSESVRNHTRIVGMFIGKNGTGLSRVAQNIVSDDAVMRLTPTGLKNIASGARVVTTQGFDFFITVPDMDSTHCGIIAAVAQRHLTERLQTIVVDYAKKWVPPPPPPPPLPCLGHFMPAQFFAVQVVVQPPTIC